MAHATMELNYNRAIPDGVLATLERAARRYGLDLESLELLGQDLAVAEAFIDAAAQGLEKRFLAGVDFEALRLTRVTRERFADRLRTAVPPAIAIG